MLHALHRLQSFCASRAFYINTQQDYGNIAHASWVLRTEADLVSGHKFGIAAYNASTVSGVVVAKQETHSRVDIRNISIAPDVRKRDFGSFAVRQLVHSVWQDMPEISQIRVDTKPTNTAMIRFLERMGFSPVASEDLYSSGHPDLILSLSRPNDE